MGIFIKNSRSSIIFLFSLLSWQIVTGCHSRIPGDYVQKELILTNHFHNDSSVFAKVSFKIHCSFDSLFIWEDDSDVGSTKKYRFTNSLHCLVRESGFIYTEQCTDSINRFTTEHYYRGSNSRQIDSTFLNSYSDWFIKGHTEAFLVAPKRFSSFILTINNRTFILLEYESNPSRWNLNTILALTDVANTLIYFRYEWTGELPDQRETALKTIQSIRIKEMK